MERRKKKGGAIAAIVIGIIVVLGVVLGVLIYLQGKEEEPEKKEIDLNSVSELQAPNEDDVIMDNSVMGHVDGELIIYFTKEATDEEIIEVIESVNGELVGKDLRVNVYQIRVNGANREELEAIVEELLEKDCVLDAGLNNVYSITQSMITPDDPWSEKGENEKLDWDEDNPSGHNWGLEATRVPSAWEYADYFTTINVGIVDDGVDSEHEDLAGMDIVILNPKLCDAGEGHGTHVTGIMMAEADNGVGMAGVLSDVKGYFVDIYANEKQNNITMTEILQGIEDCCDAVEPDENIVINLSSGLCYSGNDTKIAAIYTAEEAISTICLMQYYDKYNFIIVQAAGNDSVDACTYNGWFASVDEDKVDKYLSTHKKIASHVSAEDVMGSIMVVAAVDKPDSDTYKLTYFSNYGHTITLGAPGAGIYSTIVTGSPNGSYDVMDGTSMAAPMAAAITAMAWSVNQDLTPTEIKNLVVDSMTVPVYPGLKVDTQECYYLIDAEAAVEAALDSANIDFRSGDGSKGTGEFKEIDLYYADGYAGTGSVDTENQVFDNGRRQYKYEVYSSPIILIDVDGITNAACLLDDKLRNFGFTMEFASADFVIESKNGTKETGIMASSEDGSLLLTYDNGSEEFYCHAFDFDYDFFYFLGENGFATAEYKYDENNNSFYFKLLGGGSYEDGAF